MCMNKKIRKTNAAKESNEADRNIRALVWRMYKSKPERIAGPLSVIDEVKRIHEKPHR